MLKINNLTYRIGDRILLDQVNAVINPGTKVGLVGRNGTGKTTLFQLIINKLQSDGGSIEVPHRWTIGVTSQDAPNGPKSLVDTVIESNKELVSLWEEAKTATDPNRISEIHDKLTNLNAHSAEARAARILAGLGFDQEAQCRACNSFSGGWRMRVALASLLFTNPDLLLLDEPTNHLDLEAVLWFEDYISRYDGTVLLISHDRKLLNTAVDHIIHLEGKNLTSYKGNYDRFEESRRLKQELNAKQRVKQNAQRAHMEAFVARFRAKATKAKQAQSRLKMLERMVPLTETLEEKAPNFIFSKISELPPPLYSLEGVDVGYEDIKVLENISLRLDNDDRVALIGANGNGKSTFLKLLAGVIKEMSGNIIKSSKLRIGYFSQDLTDELDTSISPIDSITKIYSKEPIESIRRHLGAYGFNQDMVFGTIKQLSGGEKARLLFAKIALAKPHILLLDEPTNHLDILSREALIQAINGFPGAVILVSHDPHLLELTVDRFWLVANNTIQNYDGDISDYRSLLISQNRSIKHNKKHQKERTQPLKTSLSSKKDKRRLAAEQRKSITVLRKAARDAENELVRLSEEKSQILESLKNPKFYKEQPDEAQALQIQIGHLQKELDIAEKRWIEEQEALEKAKTS